MRLNHFPIGYVKLRNTVHISFFVLFFRSVLSIQTNLFSSFVFQNQLPVLTDTENDLTLGESGAINRYLIKKFGLEPAALKDYAAMNQSIEAAATMHGVLGKAHYGADRTAAMDAAFTAETGMVMKKLAGIEKCFDSSDSIFMCSEVNVGDYVLAAALRLCVDLQADCLENFPKTKALHDHVNAMETIVAYNAKHGYPYFKRNSD